MSQAGFRNRQICEGAAARLRVLLANSRDPSRRQMLEAMIARELEAANRFDAIATSAANTKERRV
jgi:hypothetical protein